MMLRCTRALLLAAPESDERVISQSGMRWMENTYPDKARGWVGFNVPMSHKITAAADLLLMPSRFEPCGLNQLYAMAYGTAPIAHATGGLRDTVIPFNPWDGEHALPQVSPIQLHFQALPKPQLWMHSQAFADSLQLRSCKPLQASCGTARLDASVPDLESVWDCRHWYRMDVFTMHSGGLH